MILLGSLFLHRVEEPFQVLLVDVVEAAVVDHGPGRFLLIPFGGSELLLEVFSFAVELNLRQDKFGEFLLNIKGQVIEFTTDDVRSLGGRSSQFSVGAREDDLHEVRIVQLTVLIAVEELHEIVAVGFSYTCGKTVISNIVEEV